MSAAGRACPSSPARPWLGLASLLGVLALAACGSGENSGTDTDQSMLGEGVSGADLPEHFSALWKPWTGDLDGMVQRRAIRVLVVHSGYFYFFDKGLPRGITADMLEEFERFLNRKLKRKRLPVYVVPIPVTRERLIPDLLAGRADLVAANLTVTPARKALVDFSQPFYSGVNEIIVSGPAAPRLDSIDALAGQEIYVRASSSYFEHLSRMVQGFQTSNMSPPKIRLVDEVLEDEDVLEMVNAGVYGITVMDDVKARFWSQSMGQVRLHENLVIHGNGDIAWAMRPGSPQLQSLVDEFVRGHRQGTLFGNVVYSKYISDGRWMRALMSSAESMEKLRPLVGLFMRYGEMYGFDWLELAAQAFQESRFDNSLRSRAGAVGIMQVKPSTAQDPNVGIPNVHELENNIHAGAKYLRFLADRYFSDASVHPLDQWLLAVAAYNAGPAKIARMRRLAEEQGYDPTVWFDNVEVLVAKHVGRETVNYVSKIFKYYVAYRLAWQRRDQKLRVMDDYQKQELTP